jgi:hypothetical protein
MAEIVSLAEGVAAAVHDGDTVAMEGFTHLIPFAAGYEAIRRWTSPPTGRRRCGIRGGRWWRWQIG